MTFLCADIITYLFYIYSKQITSLCLISIKFWSTNYLHPPDLPPLVLAFLEDVFRAALFVVLLRDADEDFEELLLPPEDFLEAERPDVDLEPAFLDAERELPPDDVFLPLLDVREVDFFEADFVLPPLDADFFCGTFSPFSLASDNPIAIACLREVTFFPLPLRS